VPEFGPTLTIAFPAPHAPPGGHEVRFTVTDRNALTKRPRIASLPTHDEPWDGSISLLRQAMYGDDGR
jgi:hypothetical protein